VNSPYSMLGIKKVDDPRNFGVASVDEEGFIEQVVEKPSIPKSNMALVGLYKIKETHFLFECLHHIFKQDIKTYGEYNLTDALDCMIKRGAKFQAFKVKNWFDWKAMQHCSKNLVETLQTVTILKIPSSYPL